MGLRELAAADARAILQDDNGFGWPICITAPSGYRHELTGFANDISRVLDPDTGLPITDRLASIAVPIAALEEKGHGIPVGVSDESQKPWTVGFKDITGKVWTFKVREAQPDRALGIVTCLLESYRE